MTVPDGNCMGGKLILIMISNHYSEAVITQQENESVLDESTEQKEVLSELDLIELYGDLNITSILYRGGCG